MSDNLRRYRAIREAFTQCSPGSPSGTVARHLSPLAAFSSGIVGSQSPQLPHLATKGPHGTTPESRVKRFARWVDNAHILEEVYFLPYAEVLLRPLALQTVVRVMDGSGVGRGCPALLSHVVSKGRALPLAWRVRPAPQGHLPAELPIALVELLSGLLPAGTPVVLLGAGAGDGTRLQHTLQQAGWAYACRTATRTVATWEGETFRLEALGSCLPPGRLSELQEVHGTREAYGPIMVLCCWAKGYHEPLYVVSNMATAEEACRWYEKRFRIATLFSDQQSRGFHSHKSHLSDVPRLSRLLIATWLADRWIVYFGSIGGEERWRQLIHRKKRCDFSLFQLGLRLLEYFLNEEMPIAVQFHVTI